MKKRKVMTPLTKHDPMSRRIFVATLGSSLLMLACGEDAQSTGEPGAGGSGGSGGMAGSGGAGTGGTGVGGEGVGGKGQGGESPNVCDATAPNIEGPYYRTAAPFRDDLVDAGMAGTRLQVQGTVRDPDCVPIADALLDVWQADDDGGYDNDGSDDPPNDEYVLRGRLNADASGNYSFRTIIPGHYLNGAQFRPAHIHIKVSAPGYETITTQLYFEGDPYNDGDAFIVDTLIMALMDEPNGAKSSRFDFTLQPS